MISRWHTHKHEEWCNPVVGGLTILSQMSLVVGGLMIMWPQTLGDRDMTIKLVVSHDKENVIGRK